MNSAVLALVLANVCMALIGAALLVAVGFVDARRSTWHRLGAAYLVGIAAVVVPSSYLALGGVAVGWTALAATTIALGVVAWLRIRSTERPATDTPPDIRGREPVLARAGVLLVVIAGGVMLLQLGRAMAARPLLESDGWAVWALKARVLYASPDAAAETLRQPWYGPPHYPLGMPTLEALGARSIGYFDGTLLDLQLLGLVVACVAAVWTASRGYARPAVAAATLLAVVAAPQFPAQLWTNYVDIPLAAVMAAAVAFGARWVASGGRDVWTLPLISLSLGFAGLLKNEGLLFAFAASIALVATSAAIGGHALRRAVVAVMGFAALVLPWRAYTAVHDLRTEDYQLSNVVDVGYLADQSHRAWPAASELISEMTDFGRWGPLSVVVVLAVAAGLLGTRRRAAVFASLWLVLAFVGLLLTYWVSVLPQENDLSNSSYRTVATLVIGGAAVVPIILGNGVGRRGARRS